MALIQGYSANYLANNLSCSNTVVLGIAVVVLVKSILHKQMTDVWSFEVSVKHLFGHNLKVYLNRFLSQVYKNGAKNYSTYAHDWGIAISRWCKNVMDTAKGGWGFYSNCFGLMNEARHITVNTLAQRWFWRN